MGQTLYPAVATRIVTGGEPVVAMYGPLAGGFITNPSNAMDQGLSATETLYVDIVGPAATSVTATTTALQPGQSFTVPPGFDGEVSVNAASSGHQFSAVVIQPTSIFTPSSGTFPPSSPTSLTAAIPSYLYQEYSDDDDLQAFTDAYNALAQQYVDWFNQIGLPIYTGPLITGALLDWVAEGLYGIIRPGSLPTMGSQDEGPLNTYQLNTLTLNTLKKIGPSTFYVTTDDVFKRIITWAFYKGDGKFFSIRWLKRRVMRFLFGTNGTSYNIDQTYPVSVTFGSGNQVNINLLTVTRKVTGGALLNFGALNTFMPNELDSVAVSIPISPLVPVFKAAVEAGVLETPFQYRVVVNTN